MKFNTGMPAAALVVSLLTGCTVLPADRGAGAVQEMIGTRTTIAASPAWPPAAPEATDWVTGPLGEDGAVRVALARSPAIRLLYAELGFAQADVHEATRLANPSIGYERLAASGGGTQATWSLSQSFMELLFAGYRGQVGRMELLQAQQRIAHDVLLLESAVREAWLEHAAARMIAQLLSGSARAAQLAAELAGRYHDAGNISALQLAREQAAASTAVLAARAQEADAARARARLLAMIGVGDLQDLSVDEYLELPGPELTSVTALQSLALTRRLDLAALRTGVTLSMRQRDHVHRWRWISGVTAEASREREPDGSTLKGGGLTLELPVFNSGAGARLRTEAAAEAAAALLAGAELDVRADVAAQFATLQAAAAAVREYRERLLPLHQRIVEYTQQQQSFMLVGTFELIESRRRDIEAWQGYIESLRTYAIARSGLARAVGGGLPQSADPAGRVTIPDLPRMTPTGAQP